MTTRQLSLNQVYAEVAPDDGTSATTDLLLVRILWIGPRDVEPALIVIDVHDPSSWPAATSRRAFEERIADGTLRPVALEFKSASGGPALTEDDLLKPEYEGYRKIRDRRWQVICGLMEDPDCLLRLVARPRPLLTETAKAHNASATHVRVWCRRYWQRGQTLAALIPDFDRCGAPGVSRTPAPGEPATKVGPKYKDVPLADGESELEGVVVDTDAREQLRRGCLKYELKKHVKPGDVGNLSPRKAHEQTLETYFYKTIEVVSGERKAVPTPGVQYPTLGQYLYHTRDLRTPEAQERARHGRQYPTKQRPTLGSSDHLAVAPGTVYQVDATVADIYLVSQRDRAQIIGRPIIYILVDMFTRMICGLHVALRPPSWRELAAALYNAFTDKVAYCAALGRQIAPDDWPCVGVPDRIMGDRGEPIRKHGKHAIRIFKFAIDTTAPYRADWKGIVESKHKFLSDEAMRWAPGWVNRDAPKRGAPDPRRTARFTLPAFTARMLEFVLWHNLDRPLRGLQLPDGYPLSATRAPCPIDLWRWGVHHRSGRLREFAPEFVRVHLSESKRVIPSRDGLRLCAGVHYTCERGEREGWFVRRSRQGAPPEVDLAWDRRRLGTGYVRGPRGEYEPARLTDSSARYAEWALDEVLDERKRLRSSQHRSEHDQRTATARRDARVAAIDRREHAAAEDALDAAGRRTPRTTDMRDHRRLESSPAEWTPGEDASAAPSSDQTPPQSAKSAGTPPVAGTPTAARVSHLTLLRTAVFAADTAEQPSPPSEVP